MRDNPRDFAYPIVFGALWGVVELTLGSILHALNVPLKGSFLTFITVGIALVGRTFSPRRGSILTMGFIAAFIKLFSFGGGIALPAIGILSEALIAELVTSAGRNSKLSYILAGGIAVMWTPFHFLFVNGMIFTGKFKIYYRMLIELTSKMFGFDRSQVALLFLSLAVLLFVSGCISGILSWHIGRDLKRRVIQ